MLDLVGTQIVGFLVHRLIINENTFFFFQTTLTVQIDQAINRIFCNQKEDNLNHISILVLKFYN